MESKLNELVELNEPNELKDQHVPTRLAEVNEENDLHEPNDLVEVSELKGFRSSKGLT